MPRLFSFLLVLLALCSPVLGAQGKSVTTKKAATPNLDLVLASGFNHLLGGQESVGKSEEKWEWPYEGVYRERGKIPIGYRVGGTSICAWAMLESSSALKTEESVAAMERAIRFVLAGLEQPRMQPGFNSTYDVRDWGSIYALNFFLRLEKLEAIPEQHREAVKAKIDWLVATLQSNAIPKTGGWNYSRGGGQGKPAASSPFMTAPAILALWQAQAQGYAIEQEIIDLALKSLVAAQVDNGVYSYTSRGGLGKIPGTIGRSPSVEIVLNMAGLSKPEHMRIAVDHFLEHWGELEKRRQKTGTHEGDYGIAPYYFYYAHYYAALAIEQLPEELREDLRSQYRDRLFASMDTDSMTFNDRVFPRSSHFGTAMSLLSLMQPSMPSPAMPK
ncbi:MAG: hypothetical protein GY747_11555 [Planctomycetes bacterium]|nr:hypothetical protein [Planctomycetota bacterium]MCP4772266.1 hypothetical protein [Planctomycetota bacterium]MCP4861322.1 hypothetical protein [Planctomycetota bacterium]